MDAKQTSFEETVVRLCAPTLTNCKTGSLFSYAAENQKLIILEMRRLNKILTNKGMCIIPLQICKDRALIYLYRRDRLCRDFAKSHTRRILAGYGYDCSSPDKCIIHLVNRLRCCKTFPHEIGLFLGYPPEDVEGFMHSSRGYKCCGAWKVYGDVKKAEETFRMYKDCERCCLNRYHCGCTINDLAVAG